ncbi:MAG: FAD:protein FMN transferase [Opitutaceae bacterium]|nr:FAD:protein FMN transferase [Opitutaceae bacterium]
MPIVVQPRQFDPRKTIFVGSVIVALTVWMIFRGQPAPDQLSLDGFTMGTTYSIKAINEDLSVTEFKALREDVERLLEDLNDQMSTYRDQSEISRFNRSDSIDPFEVSPSFAKVVQAALDVGERSKNAFDPALDPLINLWGFGHRRPSPGLPSEEQIQLALKKTGYANLEIVSQTWIRKKVPGLQLNLNAIAKGYAVDAISDLLRNRGLANTFVEIGGEIYVRGLGEGGRPWRVGIETPNPDLLPGESLDAVIELVDKAIATSGRYRNFILDKEGNTLSHILDPRTGHPVTHRLASVSVVATDCMFADGIATAVFVMGEEEGLDWIESMPDVEAFFIIAESDGSFRRILSSGFAILGLEKPSESN